MVVRVRTRSRSPGEVAGDGVGRSSVDRDAEADFAHWFGVGATAGTGDPGGGDRDVGFETASGASAIAAATCSLTAPCAAIISAGTPIRSDLASLEYETTPPMT